MPEPKGLVVVDGHPWLEIQIDAFHAATGGMAMVVLGYHAARYLEAIAWLKGALAPEGATRNGHIVAASINTQAHLGQFSSLQCALDTLGRRNAVISGCFVQPIDVPPASREVFTQLAAAVDGDACAAIPCYHEQPGHPVLVTAKLIQQILAMDAADPRSRLDHLLKAQAAGQIRYISCGEPGILANLNTPDAWSEHMENIQRNGRNGGQF